ncbi:MAG TPA: hypothetical protein VGF99_02610 [Myxococcota bacterium]
MAIQFRDPAGFWKETAAVTGGATAAGAAVGLATIVAGIGAPIAVVAGGAALLGGSVGAALVHDTPAATTVGRDRPVVRGVVGLVGGTLSALGFAALSWQLGLGTGGTLLAGALGGLALGTLLGGDGVKHRWSQFAGLLGATVVGAVGALGLDNAARFVTSEGGSPLLSSTVLAGFLGLWITAGAGLRRLQPQIDPIIERANTLLETIVEPVRTKILEALATWSEIGDGVNKDASMSPSSADETRKQAALLVEHILETGESWSQIHTDLKSPRVKTVDDKLKDLEARLAATDDDVTRGHLTRAQAALLAQKSAVDGLKINMGRAEAAIDAQLALMERLRLAVAQHRVSDRERFNVELTAVAEQAGRLSDDIEALSLAIAEAETLADRRALADLERDARKAMGSLAHLTSDVAVEHEEAAEAEARR